jgi:hypothetical protein
MVAIQGVISMRAPFAAVLSGVLFLSGCAPMMQQQHHASRKQAPAPCNPVVAPIRGVSPIVVVLTYNYAYSAKDPNPAWHKSDIIGRLNDLGRADGNSFAESNGQAVNFHITYTLQNDGNDHFTGSVDLAGWGVGHVTTISKGYPNPYASSSVLTSDLTDAMYAFIHGGWHDLRPSCPQN